MIGLITPTGARKNQIEMCHRWMQRQTYTGEVLWVIVDDCEPVTTTDIGINFGDNWTVEKIYPKPLWRPGTNTQGRNISVGINRMLEMIDEKEIQAIFIIEDDDYYKPQYLERMVAHLGNYKALGETHTIYYNVFWRRFVINTNTAHVSLFQLCFTPDLLPIFRTCYGERFIDYVFYNKLYQRGYRESCKFFREGNLAVGMKGIPGRGGIGAGHKDMGGMALDADMRWLTNIIGEDAKQYERYYGAYGLPRKPLFNSNRIRKR